MSQYGSKQGDILTAWAAPSMANLGRNFEICMSNVSLDDSGEVSWAGRGYTTVGALNVSKGVAVVVGVLLSRGRRVVTVITDDSIGILKR